MAGRGMGVAASVDGSVEGRERRNVVPPELAAVLAAAKADLEAAQRRYDSVRAVLTSHTQWQHEDGRVLCDFDGDVWPCNVVGSFGFMYDVGVPGW